MFHGIDWTSAFIINLLIMIMIMTVPFTQWILVSNTVVICLTEFSYNQKQHKGLECMYFYLGDDQGSTSDG